MKRFRLNPFWLLRGVSIALLAVVAMRPVIVRPETGVPSKWAILVDASRSMRVNDPVVRLERAKEIAASVLKRFPESQIFQFAETSAPVEEQQLAEMKPTGQKSDIAATLKTVLADGRFRGALLLTDGRQVGSGDAVSEAAAAGRPLFLVGLGDPLLFKDIAVRSVQGPPFAFKNVQTSLAANISVVGYQNQKVTVKLNARIP